MVNAQLNWASIVGIVLMAGGAMLYFMRTFKPALARDYDVFFAAVGLLCGGILMFQGWRLDPILQFGQFLLAGTTVFFAYESVRLRGVATEQARRSAYFDDEPAPSGGAPGGLRGGWDESYDRFDEPEPLRRRFSARDEDFDDAPQEDFYRPRRTSRAAIPEQAASRRPRGRDDAEASDWNSDDERSRRLSRFRAGEERTEQRADFGDRRSQREDQRRGSRPSGRTASVPPSREVKPRGVPTRPDAEDAAYSPRRERSNISSNNGNAVNGTVERPSRSSERGDTPGQGSIGGSMRNSPERNSPERGSSSSRLQSNRADQGPGSRNAPGRSSATAGPRARQSPHDTGHQHAHPAGNERSTGTAQFAAPW